MTTPLTETIRNFLDPADFHKILNNNGFKFYCGVPVSSVFQSYLKASFRSNLSCRISYNSSVVEYTF